MINLRDVECSLQGFSLGHFLGKWPKDFENDLNFEDF